MESGGRGGDISLPRGFMEQAIDQTVYASGVQAHEIDNIWKWVLPMVEKPLEHSWGELTSENVKERLKSKDMQMWVGYYKTGEIVAVMTTEIVDYPSKKACRIVTLGGYGMDEWQNHINLIENWAKHNGCDFMETYCRRGFERKMKNYGYEARYSLMGKAL